jgi:hypothetical protein
LVVVVLLVVVPPLAGSASVLLWVSELPAAPSLYVSCLVTAFPFHPVPCLVEVVLEPFGPDVTVVVDEPDPGTPCCAKATPVINPSAATPVSRCLIILFGSSVVTTLRKPDRFGVSSDFHQNRYHALERQRVAAPAGPVFDNPQFDLDGHNEVVVDFWVWG